MKTSTINAIAKEREAQDKQWGGKKHDDNHPPKEWLSYIQHQIGRARTDGPPRAGRRQLTGPGVMERVARARLVKIAALAVAAIESIDRRWPSPVGKDGDAHG